MLLPITCPSDEDYQQWLEFLNLSPSFNLLDQLGDFLANYLQTSHLKTYILGLSGGLDSSFLAALLYSRKIPYLGFCLPMHGSLPDEMERAQQVAQAYALTSQGSQEGQLHELTHLYQSVASTLAPLSPNFSNVAQGNIKARLRMVFLYHLAHVHGGAVLGTDQLDELLTGFWTVHGDVGDVAPLQLIPKSVEYALAALLCQRLENPEPLQRAIDAPPTDGLGISATDFEQLGVQSYLELEEIFRHYFTLRLKARTENLSVQEQSTLENLMAQRPVQLFLKSGFKRHGPILMDPRIFEA